MLILRLKCYRIAAAVGSIIGAGTAVEDISFSARRCILPVSPPDVDAHPSLRDAMIAEMQKKALAARSALGPLIEKFKSRNSFL
jgi:hypothetical protein